MASCETHETSTDAPTHTRSTERAEAAENRPFSPSPSRRQRCRSSQQSCHSPSSQLPLSHHCIRETRRAVSTVLPACGVSRLCLSAIAAPLFITPVFPLFPSFCAQHLCNRLQGLRRRLGSWYFLTLPLHAVDAITITSTCDRFRSPDSGWRIGEHDHVA